MLSQYCTPFQWGKCSFHESRISCEFLAETSLCFCKIGGRCYAGFLRKWFDKDHKSKAVAKERLRLVLVQDRIDTRSESLEALKNDLITVDRSPYGHRYYRYGCYSAQGRGTSSHCGEYSCFVKPNELDDRREISCGMKL